MAGKKTLIYSRSRDFDQSSGHDYSSVLALFVKRSTEWWQNSCDATRRQMIYSLMIEALQVGIIYFDTNLAPWSSSKQGFMALANVIVEITWIQLLLVELGFLLFITPTLYTTTLVPLIWLWIQCSMLAPNM